MTRPITLKAACLADETLISVLGVDASRFLQGQVTCDVQTLAVGQSTLGACCNNKGRMLALFRLLKVTDEYLLLRLPRSVAEHLYNHLSRYKVFFKCEMQVLDQACIWAIWSAHLPQKTNEELETEENKLTAVMSMLGLKTAGSAANVCRNAQDSERFEIWTTTAAGTSAESPATLTEADNVVFEEASATEWYDREFRSGIGRILPETIESFVPQMLNLQLLDAVSFKKGCYTGQEIVARTHYLGKLKKSMRLFSCKVTIADSASVCLPRPGAALFTKEDTTGEVVDAVVTGNTILVLAVIDNLQADHVELFLDPIHTSPLQAIPFPYQNS